MDKDIKTLRRMMRDEPDIANFVVTATTKLMDEILQLRRGIAHGFDYGQHWIGFAARIKSELQRSEVGEAA